MALPTNPNANGATPSTNRTSIDAELADWIYHRAEMDQGLGLQEIETGATIYISPISVSLRNQGYSIGSDGFIYNKATGFCCAVVDEGHNNYVIAVRGTDIGTMSGLTAAALDTWKGTPSTTPGGIDELDIYQDVQQGFGTLSATQSQDVLNVVAALKSSQVGANIRLVGQSLGGGDAAVAAAVSGLSADVFDPAPFLAQVNAEAIRAAAKQAGVILPTNALPTVGLSRGGTTAGDYVARTSANAYVQFLVAYKAISQASIAQINASQITGQALTSGAWGNFLSLAGSRQIPYQNAVSFDVGNAKWGFGDGVALHSPTLIALVAATGGSGNGFAQLLSNDVVLFDAFVGNSQGNTGAVAHDRSDDATAAGTSKVTVSGTDQGVLERALLKTAGNQNGFYSYFQKIFGTLMSSGAVGPLSGAVRSPNDSNPSSNTLHTGFERLALDVFRDEVAGTSTINDIQANGVMSAIGGMNGTPLSNAVIIHKADITATSSAQLDSNGLQYGEAQLDEVVWNDIRAAVGNDQMTEQLLGKRHDKIFGAAITQSINRGPAVTTTTAAQGLAWKVTVAQAGSDTGSFKFDPNDTTTGARSGDADQNLLIFGGSGTNDIKGGNKNDIIITGDGATTVEASKGNAIIVAGKGATTVNAGNGSNTIIGGSGTLTLNALYDTGAAPSSSTTETVLGGSGNCTFNMDCSVKTGPTNLLIEGGTGTNTFNVSNVDRQSLSYPGHGGHVGPSSTNGNPADVPSSFFVMWGGGGQTTYNLTASGDNPLWLGHSTTNVLTLQAIGLTRDNFERIDAQKLEQYLISSDSYVYNNYPIGDEYPFSGIILKQSSDKFQGTIFTSDGSKAGTRGALPPLDITQFLKSPTAIDPVLGNGGTNYFTSSSFDITLDFGLGNNTVWHGGDTFGETFTYARNDGNEVVDAFTSGGSSDVLQFTNLVASDVSLAISDGVNLLVTDKVTGQTIRVLNQYVDATGRYGVKTLVFSDGTTMSLGSPGTIPLVKGTSGYLYDRVSNSSVSLTDGLYVEHGQGETGQIYVYHAGDGSSVINAVSSSASADTLSLADLTKGQVTLTRVGSDLLVNVLSNGDVLRVKNQFAGGIYGVGSIAFSDGTSLSAAQITSSATTGVDSSAYVTTTTSNGTITLTSADQTFSHAPGTSGETYVYAKANGNETLDLQTAGGSSDLLKFSDLRSSDVTATIVDSYNLRLTINATGKSITVLNEFLGTAGTFGLANVAFQDISLSRAALSTSSIFTAPVGATYLYDPLSGTTVKAGVGDQYITHSRGEANQTYLYAKGDGNDVISTITPGGSSDVLKFTDMNATDILLTKSGNDLLLTTMANGQVIRVINQFGDSVGTYGVSSMIFSNGRTYDRSAIAAVANGNAGVSYAPIIDGTVANQNATDGNPVALLSGVTIVDPTSGATEVVYVSFTGGTGVLNDGAGFAGLKQTGSNVYSVTGTPAQVSAELRALTFTAVGNQPNTSSTLTFSLSDFSSAGTNTTDSMTTVVDKVSAATPVIAGTSANQSGASGRVAHPFSQAIVVDPNMGTSLTVSIQITGDGTLLDGSGFTGLKTTSTPGLYTLSGTDAAVTAELQALTFTRQTIGTSQFALSVVSSAGTTVSDSTTSVVVSGSGTVAPTITGTHQTTTTSEALVTPFSGVTIADGNAGATETLTITLGGFGGTLTDGAGFNKLMAGATAGVYTLSGSAAAITSELDALVFKPTAASPNSSATSTFKLVDASSAGTSASDTATTVIDRNPFGPDVGTPYTPPAGSDTLSCDGTYPFDYTVTGQHTVTFQAGVDSNVQVDVTNYGSRSYGDIFKYARADGNVSIRDTSGANDVLEFTDLKSTDVTFTPVYSTYETSGTGWSSLAITVTATGKTVTIDNWSRTDAAYGPQTMVFADGVTLTRAQILAAEPNQMPSAAQYRFDGAYATTHLTGQYGGAPVADVWFDKNNDTVYAASGVNTYHYASTNGTAQIFDTTAQQGVLSLSDLNASDMTFSRTGASLADLLVTVKATGKTIDVAGQFNNQGISSIVFANATKVTAAQIASATAPAPTIAGTVVGQTTTAEMVVKPFSGVTIADGNAGTTETLTITVGGSGGTLTDGSGFSGLTIGTGGVYTLSGSAAAVTSELDALVFKPTAAAPNSSTTSTFKLVDASSTGTSASDTTTTVIDRNPFGPDVGTPYTPSAGSDTLSCDGTYPFDYTVTGQHTITFRPGVDSNVQVDVTNYGSRSYGDIFKYARADGNVSIRDTSGAGDILEFTDLKSTDVTFTPVYSTYETSGTGWNSLAITVTATGKTVTLDNWNRSDAPYGPQTLVFADGVTLTRAQIQATEQNQTPSAAQYRFDGAYTTTHLTGQYGGAPVADVWFDQNNDTVYASSGVNTYHYASTNGTTQIFDTTAQQGVLSLSDLNASDITLSRTGASLADLLVTVKATGKTIDVAGQFNNQGISSIVFANVTKMTAAQIAAATAPAPTITGLTSTLTTTSTAQTIPFSSVTTADANSGAKDTLTISVTGTGGTIKDGAGFHGLTTTSTPGVYTLAQDTAANVTKELNALTFTPPSSVKSASSFFLTDTSSAGTSVSAGALSFNGTSQSVSLSGTTTVAITDLGHALTVAMGSNTQTDTITGFGTTDTTGVIDFKNGAGGFTAVSDVLNALHSDGHGGTLLSLGSTGSLDFLSTPQANLHASNFKIG